MMDLQQIRLNAAEDILAAYFTARLPVTINILNDIVWEPELPKVMQTPSLTLDIKDEAFDHCYYDNGEFILSIMIGDDEYNTVITSRKIIHILSNKIPVIVNDFVPHLKDETLNIREGKPLTMQEIKKQLLADYNASKLPSEVEHSINSLLKYNPNLQKRFGISKL